MRSKRKRHPITLLEVMIVILLIGLIGGVLSYNLKGTLDRGKVFRSEEGIARLKEILELEIERGAVKADILLGSADMPAVKDCVAKSGFIPASNLNDFLLDGWKEPYTITKNDQDEICVTSYRLDKAKETKK